MKLQKSQDGAVQILTSSSLACSRLSVSGVDQKAPGRIWQAALTESLEQATSSCDASVNDLSARLGWRKIRCSTKIVNSYDGLSNTKLSCLQSKFTDHSEMYFYSLRDCEGKPAVELPHPNFLKNGFSYKKKWFNIYIAHLSTCIWI